MIANHRKRQRGQALTLFVLALTAIVLGVAVVVDGGYAYAQRRQSQNAADFAALAGTRIVGQALTGRPAGAGNASNVEAAIRSTVAANGADLVDAQYVDHTGAALGSVVDAVTIPVDAFGVVVNANTNWSPFLLGVIGIVDWNAGATATALTPGESRGGGVLPVGIDESDYNELDSCDASDLSDCLQQPLTPGTLIGPGSFGWLSFGLNGNGGKCDWGYSLGMYSDSGCEVNQPFLQSQIGPPADSYGCCEAVGNPLSVDRIGALTGNEWGDLSFYIDNQIPVWVPIYSDAGLQGNGSKAYYDIVGFGAVVFGGADGSPHAKWLKGRRVETPWCVPEGSTDKFCPGPGGSFTIGVTGEVQLRH
jgi:hypothetical protein